MKFLFLLFCCVISASSSPLTTTTPSDYNVESLSVASFSQDHVGARSGALSTEELQKRAATAINGYTYYGCYTDNPRMLTAKVAWTGVASTTIESCTAACSAAGYSIAGTEYANECYCDNYFQSTAVKNADSQCNMTCAGNSAQSCGGSYRLSVWATSTPAAQPAATVKTSVSTFTYTGCYTDLTSGYRALLQDSDIDSAMTVEMCSSYCSGYLYMGLEYANECYCANSLTGGTAVATSTGCNMPCAGNRAEMCGGSNRLTLYTNSKPTVVPVTPTITLLAGFKGCYVDSTSSRALTYQAYSSDTNTVDTCRAACTAAGYTTAGMEYSNECWCGNAFSYGTTIGTTTDCNMICPGNGKQYCGGPNRLSVYSTQLLTVPTLSLPSPAATVSTFAYVGCYTDSTSSRTFPVAATGGTLENCAASCSNYEYFGVEYGSECYCGTTLNVAALSASSCSMACSGNSGERCGGPNALNVYKNNKAVASTVTVLAGTTALGCYQDSTGSRDLPAYGFSTSAQSWTPAICAAQCRAKGYRYSGMEYSNECYCDNYIWSVGASVGPVASTDCAMPCPGDSSLVCGGSNRINIVQDTTWTQTLFAVDKYLTYASLGCYVDSTSSRTLKNSVSVSGAMTVPKCLAACKAAGYTYCGVEYAAECYGSDTAPTAAVATSTANIVDQISQGCNMPCAGNSTLACGGSSRISVFKNLGSSATSVSVPTLL